MTAIERDALRPQLAGQRPSSLNATGLIVDGRSSTLSCHTLRCKADTCGLCPTRAPNTHAQAG